MLIRRYFAMLFRYFAASHAIFFDNYHYVISSIFAAAFAYAIRFSSSRFRCLSAQQYNGYNKYNNGQKVRRHN